MDSFNFLENQSLNYSLNILDSGKVAGDILCKTNFMHRENNRINSSHLFLFDLTVSFFPGLNFSIVCFSEGTTS